METHRIALISDTHGVLRPEVKEVLKTCEVILHAGDIGKPEILIQLKDIADTYAVRGNVDERRIDAFPGELPKELELELFGFHIYMVHDKKLIRKDLAGTEIVVFGHSHVWSDEVRGKDYRQVRFLNPGSCGPKRFCLPVTMMVLTLCPVSHSLEIERIDCLSPASERAKETEIPEKDRSRLIREIMRDVDAQKSIAEIAARHRISEKFTEQVCRMYLTHPGVDVDGIMDRIERRNL